MNETSHTLLERLREGPESLAWTRWHALYEPLIRNWSRKHDLLPDDRDDVVQNVLTVVVRRLPEFSHNGRTGAFRTWLKTITINCLRDNWAARKRHPRVTQALSALDDWAQDGGTLSRAWDLEHDRHVAKKLLSMLQADFAPETWAAFHGVVVEGRPAAEVAAEVGITTNAVYIAKSRVLSRLRQEAAGIVDDDALG